MDIELQTECGKVFIELLRLVFVTDNILLLQYYHVSD